MYKRQALVLAHPECKSTVLKLADVVGSTAALLKYAVNHPENRYIVATESGILHEMQDVYKRQSYTISTQKVMITQLVYGIMGTTQKVMFQSQCVMTNN